MLPFRKCQIPLELLFNRFKGGNFAKLQQFSSSLLTSRSVRFLSSESETRVSLDTSIKHETIGDLANEIEPSAHSSSDKLSDDRSMISLEFNTPVNSSKRLIIVDKFKSVIAEENVGDIESVNPKKLVKLFSMLRSKLDEMDIHENDARCLRQDEMFHCAVTKLSKSDISLLSIYEQIEMMKFFEKIYQDDPNSIEHLMFVNSLLFSLRKVCITGLVNIFINFVPRQNTHLHQSVLKEATRALEMRCAELCSSSHLSSILGYANHFSPELNYRVQQSILENIHFYSEKQLVEILNVMGVNRIRNEPVLYAISDCLLRLSISSISAIKCIISFSFLNFKNFGVLNSLCNSVDKETVFNVKSTQLCKLIQSLGFLRLRSEGLLNSIVSVRLLPKLENISALPKREQIETYREMFEIVKTLAVLNHKKKKHIPLYKYIRQQFKDVSGFHESMCVDLNRTVSFTDFTNWIQIVWSLCVLQEQSTDQMLSVLNHKSISSYMGDGMKCHVAEPHLRRLLNINGLMEKRNDDKTLKFIHSLHPTLFQVTPQSEQKYPTHGQYNSGKSRTTLSEVVQRSLDTLAVAPSLALHNTKFDELGYVCDAECAFSIPDGIPLSVDSTLIQTSHTIDTHDENNASSDTIKLNSMSSYDGDKKFVKLAIIVCSFKDALLHDSSFNFSRDRSPSSSSSTSSFSNRFQPNNHLLLNNENGESGVIAMKRQLLELRGYHVVVIRYDDFNINDFTSAIQCVSDKIRKIVAEVSETRGFVSGANDQSIAA